MIAGLRVLDGPPASSLALLDPQVARELGIVPANLFDEALRILAPDERLDGVPEREVGRERAERSAVTTALTP